MSVRDSLLQALVKADGDALVLRTGDIPRIVAAGRRVDLGSRALPVDVVRQLVEEWLPASARKALDESGAVAYVLPHIAAFAGEHFTVIATSGADLRVLVQRRRKEAQPPRRTPRFPPVLLLIDDSLDQLDLYEAVLRDLYQVRLASRGETGVALALADPPDLALVDLEMPGMNGWEVCRRLHADPATASLPLVILTARDEDGLRDRAAQAGAADLLSKPCRIDMLRDRIRAALAR